MRLELLVQFLLFLPMMLVSLTVHEVAHGWIAYRDGDPTAKSLGRLSLNPLVHIDPFGTILLPILLILAGAVPLGWARPVPVNFLNLRNPKRQIISVAAAGPLANLLLALAIALFIKAPWLTSHPRLIEFLAIGGYMNIGLAIFNLLPIPPLDGSKVMLGLLPPRLFPAYRILERYGFLLLLLFWFSGFFDVILFPLVHLLGATLRLPAI